MVDLQALHSTIAAVCPIDGVSDNGDGTYRIDFAANATEEQQQEAIDIAASWAPPKPKDWQGLLNDLQNSPVFARAFAAANESIPALNALNLINLALAATNRIDNLVFGFAQLRTAMPSTTAGDFTQSELDWLADRLAANGFDVALLDTAQ